MEGDPVIEFERDDGITLNSEEEVDGSEGGEASGKVGELRPLPVDEVAVGDSNEVMVLASRLWDRSMGDWEEARVHHWIGATISIGMIEGGGEVAEGEIFHSGSWRMFD